MNLPPLRINVYLSRRLIAILVAMHCAAGLAIGWALPGAWMRATGLAVLAANLAYSMVRQARGRFTGLELDQDGEFRLRRNDAWLPAHLLDAFVTPALTVLRFRLQNDSTTALTLLPDSVASDDFRRLRIILKWGGRMSPDIPVPDAD